MSGPFGKPNAKGRSSGIYSGRMGKIRRPPEGEPWCWYTQTMLVSPAWRALGLNTRRLIDFLCVEHMNHAGQENGRLRATYNQLETYGLTRELIAPAIAEAEALGFLEVMEKQMRVASKYRLTFYATHDHKPPTNDWKVIGEATALAIKERLAKEKREQEAWRKIQKSGAEARNN
jgi:hypothetical protein